MKGYKTVQTQMPSDIISAAVKLSYEATILTSAQAAIDKIGDAAYLHDLYSVYDERAAREYAAEIGQPEDTFTRKGRSPEASKAIDAKALGMWRERETDIRRYYPYFALINLAVTYVNAHCFLEDSLGQEISRVDGKAEDSKEPYPSGEPSANLISWLTAVFLTTHDKYYKTLLKEWIAYIDDPYTQTRQAIEHIHIDSTMPDAYVNYISEYVPTHERHPEIKRDFFKLLDDYFTYHIANKDNGEITKRGPYFEGTFYAFIDRYDAPTLFVPNITEATYRRYSE